MKAISVILGGLVLWLAVAGASFAQGENPQYAQERESRPQVTAGRCPDLDTVVMPAVYRQARIFGSGRVPLTGTVNESYNPFTEGKIKGYEHWARAFALAQSDEDVAIVKKNIDRELEDKRIISDPNCGVGSIF